MNDDTLKIISLCTIILGLACLFIFALDYAAVDAFFLMEDDANSFIDGTIITMRYNDEAASTVIQVKSCRAFNVYWRGTINKSEGENIRIHGEYFDGMLFADNIE